MWLVVKDKPYEEWVEVFSNKDDAMEFYEAEWAYNKEMMLYLDKELYTDEYELYLVEVKDMTTLEY